MSETRTFPPEFWAVGLDVTKHYEIEEEDKPYISQIVDVFVYNRNECTHCCELTPSYWLMYVDTFVRFGPTPSDEVKERIDSRYCHEATEDCYVHCSDVDKLKRWNVKVPGEPKTMEEAHENWVSNPLF